MKNPLLTDEEIIPIKAYYWTATFYKITSRQIPLRLASFSIRTFIFLQPDFITTFAAFGIRLHLQIRKQVKGWANQIMVFLLLALILVKTMVVPVIYLDYELRKDYIISTLCENRNRPQLHCDGKCYLAKRIAEAAKQEQKQAESDFMAKMLSAQAPVSNDFLTHFIATPRTVELLPAVTFDFSNPFNGRNFVLDIFHPPLC